MSQIQTVSSRGRDVAPFARVAESPRVSRRRAFLSVISIEMCERFGFYGLQSTVLLFFMSRLRMDEHHAILLWGAFGALVYALPSIGGWIGDRVLGARRTIAAGLLLLAGGYTLLALTDAGWLAYAAMSGLAVGSGLFKPNVTSLIRQIYNRPDDRLDVVFTIYYMAVNIGGSTALVAMPVIEAVFGWRAGFGAAACVLWIGVVVALLSARTTLRGIGAATAGCPAPASAVPAWAIPAVGRRAAALVAGLLLAGLFLALPAVSRLGVWAAGGTILVLWAVVFARAGAGQRAGLMLAYILQGQAMLFFIFNQQIATSLTLFVRQLVSGRMSFMGHGLLTIRPEQFQALNSLWILAVSPALALLYRRWAQRGRPASVHARVACGFGCLALAFLTWWYAADQAAGVPGMRVSAWVMVVAYGLFSTGEVLISPLGLAAIARYVPVGMTGTMMGGFSVLGGVSTYVGSLFAELAVHDARAGAPDITALFGMLAILAAAGGVLSVALFPVARRLERGHDAAGDRSQTAASLDRKECVM
jgi:proton-dependent oligopeptide transporter, POT family